MSQARDANRDKWQQIIDDQQASGRTVAAFCRERQVGQASFFAWRRRLSSRKASPPPRFIEVTSATDSRAVTGVTDAAPIEVYLPGCRRLLVRSGFDHDLLVELVRTLEAMP